MFLCLEPRLNWAIGPFRSLIHAGLLGTVFLQLYMYSGNQNPSCFQKTVETVLDQQYRALDVVLTVNILVKHPRSGLPPFVLNKLSYLHYITIPSASN